jgi:hypothetical protein
MNNLKLSVVAIAAAMSLAACSSMSDRGWMSNTYSQPSGPRTSNLEMPYPNSSNPPASVVTTTPDKIEGNKAPAITGPTS